MRRVNDAAPGAKAAAEAFQAGTFSFLPGGGLTEAATGFDGAGRELSSCERGVAIVTSLPIIGIIGQPGRQAVKLRTAVKITDKIETGADLARGASKLAPKGIGPDDMIPNGISFDIANPKYRRFKSGDNILEYTLEGGEITVDWVSGKNASTMMKSILDADGAGVTRISGYVTDKLGDASDTALLRLGNQMARQIGSGWKASIEMIRNRRHLVFTK